MPPAPPKVATLHKNALDVRLAESVVFLRAGDATGRQRTIQADAAPGMVRGLLVLTLAKPTRITSIEVELLGKTVTAWPEGVGARRVEITEDHVIHSQTCVFFRAGAAPGASGRRNISVGPGLALEHDDEDHSERSSLSNEHSSTGEHTRRERGRSPHSREGSGRMPRRYMSVDQTHFQRGVVAHRENTLPTIASPPYSPTVSLNDDVVPPLTPLSPGLPRYGDESPARSREDLRRAVDTEHYVNGERRSSSGFWSSRDAADSRRMSIDEDHEFQVGSSTTPFHYPGPSRAAVRSARTPSRTREAEGDESVRGRKNKRFPFASALLDAMKDRVRSSSPLVESKPPHAGDRTPPRGRTLDRSLGQAAEDVSTPPKEHSTLARVSEALGFEADEGREHGDGWKEFRKGVYTYPISFAIPVNSPPSLQVDYGSVSWKLKAVVHRPGAFKTKLTASRDITVVASPGEDDTEESESIVVERQWDTQMQYLIIISGRSFAIGGTMPISVAFMPWTKMKVHRISVLIEERVDYWTGFKRIARTEAIMRHALLALKHPKKDGPALLPLESEDPEAFKHSPLYEIIDPDDDVGEVVSSYMGPGPWKFRKDLQIPKFGLHTTNRNKRSNIWIAHTLKVIIRVERGDDLALDPSTGKRKLFDIVVQTPVHLLSPLCNPEHTALPPYTQHPAAGSTLSGPILADANISVAAAVPSPSTPTFAMPPALPHLREFPSLFHHHISPPTTMMHASPSHPRATRTPQPQSPARTTSDANSLTSPPLSRQPSDALSSAPTSSLTESGSTIPEQFERLVAGQESEEGEAPPSYEEVVVAPVSSARGSSSRVVSRAASFTEL
ncbi:uncharacterized protein BXZ73DRAFT_41120 [Epithele typhae]|uniref:uncharacterized protein n=1 Tax=Epithele typhae TaxID=378194 RepID=UPI002008C2AE|nr:uncharacterized protein BXZ73DRAFT_41120 [Epithele typhae]KAH9942155.1 hypothetical protein BXZ73DRAFT_41120 [Epithele typhae]